MTKQQKRTLARVLVTAVLFAALFVCERLGLLERLPHPAVAFGLYLAVYLLIGWDVIAEAAVNVAHGQVFDENFLMLVATVAAFAIGEYEEAVAVMLFYQVGELFQSCAVGKSRRSIAALMDIAPEFANVEEDGELRQVDPDEVEVGTVITVRPGERVPLDGVVLEGESLVDTSALTGESVPRSVRPGSELISGCINGAGLLRVRTTRVYEDSTVARILELTENAASRKAKTENFITQFARWYTPVVTLGALLLAVLPPLLLGGGWSGWIRRACIFLVISCPCALVISVPMGFFGGIGAASRAGVLVKGSNCLETASKLKTFVFDKTGTLTRGEFAVTRLLPQGCTEAELLELAAHGEGYSAHPIAASIRACWGRPVELSRLGETDELAGCGLRVQLDGRELLLGNAKLMALRGIEPPPVEAAGTVVYVAAAGEYRGAIVISDRVKDGAKQALAALKDAGASRLVMLTGDREAAARAVAAELGMDDCRAELLPADKVLQVERLLGEQTQGTLAFVGDGVNDAPVLTRADLGVAMGALGSDAAIEAADVVIMDDELSKLPTLLRIARKTLRIVRQNIVFALAVKLAILCLGALGLANLWLAVFADVGVAVLAILNSMRALKAAS